MKYTIYHSPICDLIIIGSKDLIDTVTFDNPKARVLTDLLEEDSSEFKDLIRQFDEYFEKKRKSFDINLNFQGTPFQKKVWQALREIPYGETLSYKELAEKAGFPNASRAVGSANRVNSFSIVVPCHRVIKSNGDLAGFAGRPEVKRALLNLEGVEI